MIISRTVQFITLYEQTHPMRFIQISLIGLLICSCGSESEADVQEADVEELLETDSIVDDGPDYVEQGENMDFNELYDAKLAATCNCDLTTSFELDGEGEVFPLKVHRNGSVEEYMVIEAHTFAFDPVKNGYYIDLLEDGTEFPIADSAYALWQEANPIAYIEAGPVREWPDMMSYVNFDLQTASYWEIFGCYENWVKVRQWNDGASEYSYGWIPRSEI